MSPQALGKSKTLVSTVVAAFAAYLLLSGSGNPTFIKVLMGISFRALAPPFLFKSLLPAHDIISSVATAAYAVASSSGFAFGLNFGEDAGAATEVWIICACIVQGSQ